MTPPIAFGAIFIATAVIPLIVWGWWGIPAAVFFGATGVIGIVGEVRANRRRRTWRP